MKKHDVVFTHYGWYGCFPVIFSGLNDDLPIIEVSWFVLWLLVLDGLVGRRAEEVTYTWGYDYKTITIMGRLTKPKVKTYGD